MLDKQIKKFPIIIISTPRSGSTALGEHLVNTYNLEWISEPDSKNNTNILLDLNHNEFVLKFHAYRITHYPRKIIEKIELNDCFLIRIRRRNIVDQIASVYIATKRNIYYYTNEIEYNDVTEIDIKHINRSINSVMYFNKCALLKFKYDMDLFYEDIEDTLTLSIGVKTPKYILYEEIKDIIKQNLFQRQKRFHYILRDFEYI